jgi:hypothetical protein
VLDRRTFICASSFAGILWKTPATSEILPNAKGADFKTARVQIGTPLVGQDNSVFKNWALNLSNLGPNGTTFAYPALLNVDGYPTGTLPADLVAVIPFPQELVTLNTTLVFAWSGDALNGESTAIGVSSATGGFHVTGTTSGTTVHVPKSAPFNTTNLNAHGTDGYIEFNFTGAVPTHLVIGFQNGSHFGNNTLPSKFRRLIFCLKSDYNSVVNATSPADLFSKAYIDAWKALKPKTIRTMNQSGANGGNMTQLRYQNNWATALTFQGNRWVPNCWAGGPGAAGPNITGTNHYICAAAADSPLGPYVMGEVIQGQFQHASTTITSSSAANNGSGNTRLAVASTTDFVNGATCTVTSNLNGQTRTANYTMSNIVANTSIDINLAYDARRSFQLVTPQQTINVNGRGAVPILDVGGSPMTVSINTDQILGTLIYDDLLDGFMLWTSNGTDPGLNTTWPVEVHVALANAIGCNLWYNLPPHLTHKSSAMEETSSIAQTAALISGSITNGCYFEFGNEVWNPSGGFFTTTWAINCAMALGFVQGLFSFYGLCIARTMPVVRTAWGTKPGLTCVNACHAGWPGAVGGQTNLYRLNGAELRNATSPRYASYVNVDYSLAGPTWSRPIDQCDTVSYATYYEGAQCQGDQVNYTNSFASAHNSNAFLSSGGPMGGSAGLLGAADDYASGDPTLMAQGLAWLDWDVRGGLSANIFAQVSGSPGAALYSVSNRLPKNTNVAVAGSVSVPGGLTAGAVYFIVNNTGSSFNLALTANGPPITISNNGSGIQSFGTIGQSTISGLKNFWFINQSVGLYAQFEQIAQSYDGARPPGRSRLTIEHYEGGFGCVAPDLRTCTTIGISTTYAAKINNLLTAYKTSSLLAAAVKQQLDDFFNTAPVLPSGMNHSVTGSWYEMTGGDRWSIYRGNVYTAQWQSASAVATYNNGTP